MESFVLSAIQNLGIDAGYPKTCDGKGKTTGYPDIRMVIDGEVFYLEVKSFAAKNRQTTQRSFYLSPSATPKVTEAAVHLLVGFEIVRNGNEFRPVAFELIDLYGLPCDMKSEFNSDNKRLYEDARILKQERVER